MQGLAKFLEDGGTLMYVNLVVSIITLSIIIDRAIFFLGKGSVNAKAFLAPSSCAPRRRPRWPRSPGRASSACTRARSPSLSRSKRRWST